MSAMGRIRTSLFPANSRYSTLGRGGALFSFMNFVFDSFDLHRQL